MVEYRLADAAAVLHRSEVCESWHRQKLSMGEAFGYWLSHRWGELVSWRNCLAASDNGRCCDGPERLKVRWGARAEDLGLCLASAAQLDPSICGERPELGVGSHRCCLAFRKRGLALQSFYKLLD